MNVPVGQVDCAGQGTGAAFQQTRWSMVLKACAGSSEALEELGRSYWPAVYAFVRRKGFSPPDAEDITQHTFARLLKLGQLTPVDPAKGRFRSYLRACTEHEASHFLEYERAAKRRVDRTFSLEMFDAEKQYHQLPATTAPAEHVFDRAWSQVIVGRALSRLASEYARLGKGELYGELLALLQRGGNERGDFLSVATALSMSEGAVRVSWLRFKTAFVKHLREEVARTVADESDIEQELRHLLVAWSTTGTDS